MDERVAGKQVTPDAILQLGLGFWGSKALLSAVELGLFTELASGGPLGADALASWLGLHARGARDFLDALVALRMLDRSHDCYANTPAADLFLDRRKPSYLGGILEMANTRLYPLWGSLTEAMRTGQPQNEAKHGGNVFAKLYADPERLKAFLKAMTGISLGSAQAVAAKFPWHEYRTLVDVGAAEGALPVGVASMHQHVTGTGFDLPEVRPHFEAYVAVDDRRDPRSCPSALCKGIAWNR